MRADLRWFSAQAERTWRAMPGRSFSLLVPYGCNDIQIAGLVRVWLKDHFQPPKQFSHLRVVVIPVASDSTSSSQHFVARIVRALVNEVSGFEIEGSDYPSDDLEDAISQAHKYQIYPLILIERFHGFARVADGHLLSVLSKLRELEHNLSVTTLTISPLGYDQIRRELSRAEQFPFVNSSYGDNHDRAIIEPVTREEFLAEAQARGVEPKVANRVYSRVGGPDAIAVAALDALRDGVPDSAMADAAIFRLGSRLDNFLKFSLSDFGDHASETLERLATSTNTPAEIEYISKLPFFPFLVREVAGRQVCVSSLLSRMILSRTRGPLGVYYKCLNLLSVGDYSAAAKSVEGRVGEAAHLRAFIGMVRLLAAVYGQNDPGLLGIDWYSVARESRALLDNQAMRPSHRRWVENLEKWSRRASQLSQGASQIRMSDLTVEAADKTVREMILFSAATYMQVIQGSAPGDQVVALSSMPETVLQTLAAAFCGFSHNAAPMALEGAPFEEFFGRKGYRHPEAGSRLDLTGLLVLVPIHLRRLFPEVPAVVDFCDPRKIVSLQGKLVARLRNVTAHSYGAFAAADARLARQVSTELLDLLACLSGHKDTLEFIDLLGRPTVDDLTHLLAGTDPFDSQTAKFE